jgi:ribonucleoside-diphosphate reductase alpha subunit
MATPTLSESQEPVPVIGEEDKGLNLFEKRITKEDHSVPRRPASEDSDPHLSADLSAEAHLPAEAHGSPMVGETTQEKVTPSAFKSKRYVIKRKGFTQEMRFDKITARIERFCYGLDADYVDPSSVAQSIMENVHSGVKTSQIDELAAEKCAINAFKHPDFSILAGRIAVSNLHKMTKHSWAETVQDLYAYVHPKTEEPAPVVSKEFRDLVVENAETYQAMIDYERDFYFEYFGLSTLLRAYLLKIDGKTVERPQMMYMRVAAFIHGTDFARVKETYDLISTKHFTHATPTLFNAGTPRPQLSSCFLVKMKEDSIEGIFDTLKTCACISKYAGGIGLSIHNIRATDSYIRGTGGQSNGLVPMLRVFTDTARFVDQGGGKRPGSIAIYLEPWHADIEDWLLLKLNFGKEEKRARDLFYAVWVSDLFMERVKRNEDWSLFCPNEAPGLADVCGDEFVALYERYEAEGRARKTLKARHLYHKILEIQIETGTPYVLFKDAANSKTNHRHLGVLKLSNLCAEILEYVSEDEIAVCNLASLCLNAFVKHGADGRPYYDFDDLIRVVRVAVRNLDIVVTKNYYPVPEAETSNMRHRPVGLGVQGLADAVATMGWAFDDEVTMEWNKRVFETIYYAAIQESLALAKEKGAYPTFAGSPMSKGLFQFDLWGVKAEDLHFDWSALREEVMTHGLRNSLLVALMPTASTAQIFGNNEAFEPFTSNLYKRRVTAGEFLVVNRYLVKELCARGLWHKDVRDAMIANGGSVQRIPCIPKDIKRRYRTVWEISQLKIIDMAADRGPFVDQTQSMNLHIADPTPAKLQTCHFRAYERGLKTGMYYLRSKGQAQAAKYTIDPELVSKLESNAIVTFDEESGVAQEGDICLSCGS